MTNTKCSDDDYSHANIVWTTFRCKTNNDYLLVYLKADVLIFADI